jgi:cardiolipin synthase
VVETELTPQGGDDARHDLRRTLECLVGAAFTEGNAITVLRNGDQIFPAMLEAIREARHSVDLMTFVYWKGWPAQEFADALCERANAGLRVRVLIDALGGRSIEDGLIDAMDRSGVDVHWFRKPLRNSPFKQNHRGHRKLLVVDETIGFTGGVGIAEKGFELLPELWAATLDVIRGCPCESGCPSCVQSPKCGNFNQPLDKRAAEAILTWLLEEKRGRKR